MNKAHESKGIQTENPIQHIEAKIIRPKISVIAPTRNRAHFLPKLIENFEKQTWNNKELLILDDTPQGELTINMLQAKHKHIRLYHSHKATSIGAKRNQLIEQAEGSLIAHFDDDDFYAPTYLEVMASNLLKSNHIFIKLTGWFCFHQASKTLGYWDTTRQDLPHTVFTGGHPPKAYDKSFTSQNYRSFLTGYGFSYLYQKQAWEKIKFHDINLGEDTQFHEDVKRHFGVTQFIEDKTGICAHIIHQTNTSRCFPNHIIPRGLENKYFDREHLQHASETERETRAKHKRIKIHSATREWGNNAPTVSICTLTYNRNYFLPLLKSCIEKQDYPHSKIEWLILNDSSREFDDPYLETDSKIRVKYQRTNQKLSLGKKRNLSHQLCSGDYIIYMDDDDYYYPTRVSHAVSSLIQSGKPIAGSTLLQIYYCHDQQLWLSGPFGENHATAGTFAMTKEFARSQRYKNEDTCNEEKHFLQNYKIPMAQLDPTQTLICISHKSNTFDKKKMRNRVNNSQRLRKLSLRSIPEDIRNILKKYQEIYKKQYQ